MHFYHDFERSFSVYRPLFENVTKPSYFLILYESDLRILISTVKVRFVIYVFYKIMFNMERSLVTKYTRNMYRVKYYHEDSFVMLLISSEFIGDSDVGDLKLLTN